MCFSYKHEPYKPETIKNLALFVPSISLTLKLLDEVNSQKPLKKGKKSKAVLFRRLSLALHLSPKPRLPLVWHARRLNSGESRIG